MTDDSNSDGSAYRLSRRGVLGGLATLGTVAAGAGLTTTALFSDSETIDGEVTAGTLDLSVDWEEHYLGSLSAVPDAADVKFDEPSDTDAYVPFPAGAGTPELWVNRDDTAGGDRSSLELFMDETTLESFPDEDDDGVQDDLSQFDPCKDFAQAGTEDLDPTVSSRTQADDTVVRDDDGDIVDYEPMVSIENATPGDFGEVTLSMHLCESPGYVWLQSNLVDASENGYTEPETNAPEESGDANGDGEDDRVELLDAIQTFAWYDEDGDNVYEPGTNGETDPDDPAEVMLVLDVSGSMSGSKIQEAKAGAKQLVNAVGEDDEVGLVTFASGASVVESLTEDAATVESAIDGLSADGSTDMESAIDAAADELETGDSERQYMVVLSDGHPNVNGDGKNENDPEWQDADPTDNADAAKDDGVKIYTIGYEVNSKTMDLLETVASSPADQFAYEADVSAVTNVFGQIGKQVAGEDAFFRGSLREFLAVSEATPDDGTFGIPLDGDRSDDDFEEVTGTDTDGDDIVDADHAVGDASADARDPFVEATINQIGVSWWIPESVGNEIQSDSVKFDLGFYAEQAANNSGGGSA